VRDLISGYIVSDGRGGWRKNEKAATELEKLSAEETSQIWPLLKDSQPNVRRGAAVFFLGQFDEANSQQVEAFTALLSDADAFVRARALDAARQFVTTDKILALPKVAALLEAAHEDRAENRAAAVRLCGAMKKDARDVLPTIEKAATADPDAKVRAAAAMAAAQIADPQAVVEVLKNVLTDKDPSVRLVAAARLRQLGRDAAPAAKELAAVLADSDKDVAEAAAEALIRVGAPAVDSLAEQLSSTSLVARKLALACLAKLGPIAKSAAPRITKCKQDADSEVRQLAEVALKSTGSP
jgi:HEAT repeat protein